MTYSKIGGLHFVRVGRYGASFYVSKRKTHQLASWVTMAALGWIGFVQLLLLVD